MAKRLEDSEWGFFAFLYGLPVLVAILLGAYFLIDAIATYSMPFAAPYIGDQAVWWAVAIPIGIPAFWLYAILRRRWESLVRIGRKDSN
jgi:hypothetical protein